MEYKRRTFIIDKRFQLKFSLYVCSWMFVLSLIYPLIIYNLFDFFLRHSNGAFGTDGAALAATRNDILFLLIFLQALFLGVTVQQRGGVRRRLPLC